MQQLQQLLLHSLRFRRKAFCISYCHAYIKEIIIKKDVVDPDDVEMLQDLVLTAVNEALKQADSMMEKELGGFNIPGLF